MNSEHVKLIARVVGLLALVGVIIPSQSSSNGHQRAEKREVTWYRE